MSSWYAEAVGHRWGFCPVAHPTEERAREDARRSSLEALEARVYDCSSGPVGRLVARYVRGVEVPA